MDKMSIREYYELVENENEHYSMSGFINEDIDKFYSPDKVRAFEILAKKIDKVGIFYIQDVAGNLCVYDNNYFCWGHYPDDTPMVEVFDDLFKKMKIDLIGMKDKFLDMYNSMDKWVVIAKCSDGGIVIGKDGEIAFDIDIAGEIAKYHQNMGAEIAVMRYEHYKGIYEKN